MTIAARSAGRRQLRVEALMKPAARVGDLIEVSDVAVETTSLASGSTA
jgi:hypothetical protein